MTDNPEISPSPLEGLSLERFKHSTYTQETIVSVGLSRVTLIRNNPNRLFWSAINEGGNDVRLSTDPNITALSGWLITANGGVISMFWEEDGEGVGYEIFAIAGVAGQTIRVREVIMT